MSLDANKVYEEIKSTLEDTLDNMDWDTDRNSLIERLDEDVDGLWGNLVYQGMISQWDEDTLATYAEECGVIISYARREKCLESDTGLWEGSTFGVLPSMAFFSLRNLMVKVLNDDFSIDVNDDEPLRAYGAEKFIEKMESVQLAWLAGRLGDDVGVDDMTNRKVITQILLDSEQWGLLEEIMNCEEPVNAAAVHSDPKDE